MNTSLTCPSIILFDWDGTLANTHDLIRAAYAHTFKIMHETPFPLDDLHQLPGTSLRDFFPILFGDRASHAETLFYDYVTQHHLEHISPMEGAQDLLDTIDHHKIIMGVVSNKRGDLLRKEVDHFGWGGRFYRVVGSRDCLEDKPSPLVIDKALEGLERPEDPESVWFVGDWVADLEVAHYAHLVPVLIHNYELNQDPALAFKPKIYVDSCLDLKKVLIKCKDK